MTVEMMKREDVVSVCVRACVCVKCIVPFKRPQRGCVL